MEKIKIIFVGTDSIGTELLKAVSKVFDVMLVVTGQDKPAGRKLQLQPSFIKVTAKELGLEVFQPLNINAELSVRKLANLNPDIVLVMAYGQILSEEVLKIPKYACVNVHASLLPKYRGASPIQAAILNMDKKTGISVMKMVKQMDAGPVYRQFELDIESEDTSRTLCAKLGILSAKEVPRVLIDIERGLKPEDQYEPMASYCGKISKADGQIDWKRSADEIVAQMRAFDLWPGTYTFFGGKRLKILSAEAHGSDPDGKPGLVKRDGIVCGSGYIFPLELQLEGGGVQLFKDFINGHPDFIGSIL